MKEKRLISIIENLILNDDIQIISDISNKLNVSERTVRTDLDQIETLFSSYKLKLNRKPGVGVWVEGSEENKNEILRDLSNRSVEDRYSKNQVIMSVLIDILTNTDLLNKTYFSEKYFVSKSLFNKYILDLKNICFDNNLVLEINSRHNFYISGEQIDKVNLLYKLLKKKINKDYRKENSFIKDLFTEINQILIEWITSNVNELINQKQIEDISYFILSLALIPDFLADVDYVDNNIYKSILNSNLDFGQLINSLSERLDKNFSYIEKKYITIKIYEKLIVYDKFKIKDLDLKAKLIFEDYIENLNTLFSYDLNIENSIYDVFLDHLSQIIYRAENKLSIYNPLADEIKKRYKKYFYITQIINSSFKKILGIEVSDEEISYISLYMYIFIEDKSDKIKAGVICQYGVGVSKALIFRLKNEYPNINFYSIGVHDIEQYNDLDIYLSTIHIESNKNIILISPFLDVRDKMKIENHLYRIENDLSLIDENCIEIVDYEVKSNELLRKSCSKLFELGYVDEYYYESVLEREELGSTEIGNGVVLTHGIPKLVNKSVIYFNILKKPIFWDDEKVNLVVILSLTAEDSKKNIDLNWLWKFLNSEKLKNINNIDKKEEFIKLILSR